MRLIVRARIAIGKVRMAVQSIATGGVCRGDRRASGSGCCP